MIPLAERVRPQSIKEYIGQNHLIGESGVLSKLLQSGHIPSLILWGPPGVGKTTLANLIAQESGRTFYSLSAINSGVKDVRATIEKAQKVSLFEKANPILFIDEIHRFSKSQQDSLLGAVEKGTITLIGATTENPSFEVISALLSRCQTLILKPHTIEDLEQILDHALQSDEYLNKMTIDLKEKGKLLQFSGGDARKLLNCLEIVISHFNASAEQIVITDDYVTQTLKNNPLIYDKGGEMHYDIISAFIKSIRGSDPNATVYYLARMIEGGEDPKFICRRMIISASEDVGLANPNALLLANACFDAVQKIGMPEGQIPMSQCAVYLATCEKSNATYMAIKRAKALIKETGNLSIPLKLRNAPTELMKNIGFGDGYKYAHNEDDAYAAGETYLPEPLEGRRYYEPVSRGLEIKIRDKLAALRQKDFDAKAKK